MHFVLTRAPDEFAERALVFLEPRIECNVMAGVLSDVRSGVHSREALFAYATDEREETVFAAVRTPPWPLLVSPLDAESASTFVTRWLAHDPEVPAVNGLAETVQPIAAAWAAATGGSTRPGLRQAMHSLREVLEPARPAAGRLRPARTDELPLLLDWWEEFSREAGVGVRPGEPLVRARLEQGRVFLWEDGEPVSLVAIAAEVAGVARIGPVYTPPSRRRLGYAGTAVAAISRLAIERGAHTCMLFTDVANPTSNKIYAEVGYRRIADWEEQRFIRR